METKDITLYPLLFEPNMKEVVWGGSRLKTWKGLEDDKRPIGESWEVSAIDERPGIISNGQYRGTKITEIIEQFGERILGKSVVEKYGREMPLLVKFIDARHDLSIQVHPNDEMAMKHHGKRGKTEMWYVIDAEPGASLFVGFKEHITPYEFACRTKDGSICDVLARHEVKTGDVFYIPSGRVHAICGGILLVEVQQSSDLTYRIFDYNRKDINGEPRELHIDKAKEAIDYEVLDDYRVHYMEKTQKAVPVIKSPFFNIRVIDVEKSFHRNMIKYDSFVITVCLSGTCTIKSRMGNNPTPTTLREGNSCLIPAELADYDIVPIDGKVKILETFIDNLDTSIANKINRFFHLTSR